MKVHVQRFHRITTSCSAGLFGIFDLVVDVIAAERKIKCSSRAKKEALIQGDWKLVQAISKRRGAKGRGPS
jgi:hypothetical protein